MPICRPPLGEPRLMPSCCSPLGEPGLMPSCCSPFCLLGGLGEHGLMPICCSPNDLTISRIISQLVRAFSKEV
jgi:hypothetical protein